MTHSNPGGSDLPALYKKHKICLWVEDPLTRTYLETLWSSDLNLGLLVAGGHEGTRAVAELAFRDQILKVFGLVDRDFGNTNRHQWANPPNDLRCYRTEAHEVENFLLDSDALAASQYNSRERKPAEILEYMQKRAHQLTWWMASRQTLAELRMSVTDGFPGTPTTQAQLDRETAFHHILRYARTLPNAVNRWTDSEIERVLEGHHRTYTQECDSGGWQRSFSGKEIFASVCGFISIQGVEKSLREEVAKDVAEFQRKQEAVPPELTELRTSLYNRVMNVSPPPL